MSFLRRLWDEAGNVSEDEPTVVQTVIAGAVFVLCLLVLSTYLWLMAPGT